MEKTPGEEFIELGLLFIVTGLAVVVIVAIVEFLLLRESWVLSNWGFIPLAAVLVSALGVLVFRLLRRLLWFLARLK